MNYFNPDKVDTFDFDLRDISVDELQGMFASARYVLSPYSYLYTKPTKLETRMAQKLLRAALWIEREAYLTSTRKVQKDEMWRNDNIFRINNGFINEK